MTELERLDMCIAEVNGVRDVAEGYHRDWRALMAAVEQLEPEYRFHRDTYAWTWSVSKPNKPRPVRSWWWVESFDPKDGDELLALAKCIAAAVEHKERLGRAEEGEERE